MSHGRLIRGIVLSNEEIKELEKEGLTGDLLDLHLSFLHISGVYSLAKGCYEAYMEIWKARHNTTEKRALPVHHFKDFFRPVEQSLWQNTILSIAHLVEDNKKTLNLRSFLDDLEAKKALANNPRGLVLAITHCRNLLNEEENAKK